jgi:hypothetical protein
VTLTGYVKMRSSGLLSDFIAGRTAVHVHGRV